MGCEAASPRSLITIDTAALRANVRRLQAALGRAELWAVVKADGYGHGAETVARVVLEEGARALCVATAAEALALRAAFPQARLIVLGPTPAEGLREAREARLELTVADGPLPDGIPLHLKLDTGMGRWGFVAPPPASKDVVGLMSHLASADADPAFTETQIERFAGLSGAYPGLTRHLANSAGVLRFPASHFDAGRPGIALYGLSPFGSDPAADGLRPVLRWQSTVRQVKQLQPGESTGYGRRFVAREPAWIGIVPIGYADGFRRDLTGAEVLVAGTRCRVVGVVSMDALAVALPDAVEPGAPVTLIGDGVLAEELAAVAGTITYELVCGISSAPTRARRVVR